MDDYSFSEEDLNAYIQQLINLQGAQPVPQIPKKIDEEEYLRQKADDALYNYLMQANIAATQPNEPIYDPSSISDEEINRMLISIL